MSEKRPRAATDLSASKAECDRQYHNIDLRITAHSILRDRFAFRSLAIKIFLFATSIVSCGFTFSDDKTYSTLRIKPDSGRVVIGLASIILAALSVTELLTKWDQKTALHDIATKQLSALKRKYRIAYTKYRGNDVTTNDKLSREWDKVHENLPEIPEREFVVIKMKHTTKRQLAQLSDQNRDIPHYLLVILFHWRALQKLFKGQVQTNTETSLLSASSSLAVKDPEMSLPPHVESS